ncbi:membrane protein [Luteimonas padinae]|uniref:DnaJ family molecular chaperone n=1 Tax=Luteimonas padinae TaxID=1714359 RepID=A0ABV6SWI8_9GAMM|nr:DnaJ domain-containing protein [Luteimonas padinae]GHD72192.1 membrane protein [Luteimonas padinae]
MKRSYGKVLGFIAGWLLMRHPAGGLIGLLIGHAFDSDWFRVAANDAYAVLGVERDASDIEIDLAYRRLIAQVHPDRMAGAAPELLEQAQKRAADINRAYDRIRKKRGRR